MENQEIVENIKQAFEYQRKGQYAEAIATLYKLLAVEPDNVEALIQIAYLFYLRNDAKKSIEYYEKALQVEPENIPALQGLFDIFKSEKNFPGALDLARNIFDLNSDVNNFAQLLMTLLLCNKYHTIIDLYQNSKFKEEKNKYLYLYFALANYHTGKSDVAKEYFHDVLELDANNVEAMFYLANIFFHEKDYRHATELSDKILAIKDDARVYNLKGLIQLDLINNAKALGLFTSAVKMDRENAEYIYNLGIAYSLNGWFNEAQKCFSSALILEPDNIDYHYALAYLYYELGQLAKSDIETEYILKYDPEYTDARVLQALLMAENHNSITATEVLEDIIAQNPENDFACYGVGIIYKNLEQYDKAVPFLEKAASLKGNSADYLYQLAETLYKAKNYEKSLDVIKDLLNLNGNYVAGYVLKAKILIKLENYDAVEYVLSDILSLNNSSHEAFYLRAKLYYAKNLPFMALREIKHAITLMPDNEEYYEFIAEIYASRQEYSDAVAFYEELQKFAPHSAKLYLASAECAEQAGDEVKAGKYYFRAYTTDPNDFRVADKYINFLVKQKQTGKALSFMRNLFSNGYCSMEKERLSELYNDLERKYLKHMPLFRKLIYKAIKI